MGGGKLLGLAGNSGGISPALVAIGDANNLPCLLINLGHMIHICLHVGLGSDHANHISICLVFRIDALHLLTVGLDIAIFGQHHIAAASHQLIINFSREDVDGVLLVGNLIDIAIAQ